MICRTIVISNKLGLHARASAKLSQTAARFASKVSIGKTPDSGVDCKSIMALMMQAAAKGTEMHLMTDGEDEQEAMAAVVDLIERKFDEGE